MGNVLYMMNFEYENIVLSLYRVMHFDSGIFIDFQPDNKGNHNVKQLESIC